MCLMFVEQLGDARRAGTWLHEAALWMQATRDLLTIAPKEHWHVIRQDLRYPFRTMAGKPPTQPDKENTHWGLALTRV